MFKKLAAAFVGLGLATGAMASSLDGKVLTFTFSYDDVHFSPHPEYFTIGPGLESPNFWGFSVDVDDDSITFTDVTEHELSFVDDVVIRIRDVNHAIDPFRSVSVNAALSTIAFDNSMIRFDEDNIYLNFGIDAQKGQKVVLDFIAAVPEPASVPLLLAGLVPVGLWVARFRRDRDRA